MIVSGYILLIIGVLAVIGNLLGSAGITIYSFILPIIGLVLLICGYLKKK